MSIKKSLVALAVAAFAMMGFASSAMASGTIKDVDVNEQKIPANHAIHLTGWAQFEDSGGRGVKCHATSNVTPSAEGGETGSASFSVPSVANCKTFGSGLSQCAVTAVHVTNSPYHVTSTTNDFDITGEIVIHTTLKNFLCPTDITVTFSSITATILKTGETAVTGSEVKKDGIGAWGDPIAGVTIEGTGETHSVLGTDEATAHGELMVTEGEDLCTWKLT